MQKKERKQRVRKTPPLLPRLVILFFLLMVLLFMNIDMCSRILNFSPFSEPIPRNTIWDEDVGSPLGMTIPSPATFP